MRNLIPYPKVNGIIVMLLCVVVFSGCSKDIPKLLDQGKAAFLKADYAEAKKAFKECADGYGTMQEAFDRYMKAADQGDTLGMTRVGKYILTGKAGKIDYAMAKRYLRKAASLGDEEAQELLKTYQILLKYV